MGLGKVFYNVLIMVASLCGIAQFIQQILSKDYSYPDQEEHDILILTNVDTTHDDFMKLMDQGWFIEKEIEEVGDQEFGDVILRRPWTFRDRRPMPIEYEEGRRATG